MARPFLFTVVSLLLAGSYTRMWGQGAAQYHIDIHNGLPSNYVYHAIEDRLGYLWIATNNGVVRYNGYEFTPYNLSDGLPTADIWELLEDRAGRIWLGNISDEYGFIYNNEYHKTYVPGKFSTIYPRSARRFGEGVIFFSLTMGGKGVPYLCIGGEDSIRTFAVADAVGSPKVNPASCIIFMNEQGKIIIESQGSLYEAVIKNARIETSKICDIDETTFLALTLNTPRMIGNYVFSFDGNNRSNVFFATDIRTGKLREVRLDQYGVTESVSYLHEASDNGLYTFTSNYILSFKTDTGITLDRIYRIADLLPGQHTDGSKIKLFWQSKYWRNWIGTTTEGFWIDYGIKNRFLTDQRMDLRGYKLVGGRPDDMSFWWNSSNSDLLGIGPTGAVRHYGLGNINKVNKVLCYSGDTFLLTNLYSYYLNAKTGEVSNASSELNGSVSTAIRSNTGDLFLTNNIEFFVVSENPMKKKVRVLDYSRYNDLSYDSLRHRYWAYNYNKVYVYGENDSSELTKEKLTSALGVTKVEKIVMDNRYGNIFVKGPDDIMLYDAEANRHRPLFTDYNVKELTLFVHNGLVIACGPVGVLFARIEGRDSVSPPLLYPNVKGINYSYISDAAVTGGAVLLNTDKGTYRVQIPSDSEILAGGGLAPFDCRYVLNYRDTLYNYEQGDTIKVEQTYRRLQFDVINPLGYGHVKYLCQLRGDSAFHELNANELTLPGRLEPGIYYKLSLKVYDNIWRSSTTDLYLFIEPYWFQTYAGSRIVWSGVALSVLLLLTLAVLVTKRLVNRANEKRNASMELELKSIYAQLNPHFVFNTLNSALHFIKKEKFEDAVSHINKFSRLLRSYLDSSKNRYIALSDEISNLRNYIEIQQTRFPDRFTYEIKVAGDVNAEHVKVPSLLLQPIVENAISHGLVPKEDEGHLTIAFLKGSGAHEIICVVDDNGIGRKRAEEIRMASSVKKRSLGDGLVSELVAIINKYEKMNIEIVYTDKEEPQTGTTVTVKIRHLEHE